MKKNCASSWLIYKEERKMCIPIICIHFVGNIIIRRTEQDMVENVHTHLHVKYPLVLSDFNETRIFAKTFAKNTLRSNLMKILPVGAELFHTDR